MTEELIKYINPIDSGWFEGEQIVTPLEDYSLIKSAGIDVSDVHSEPGKTKLHVLALGAGEYWGANRNGDFFPEDALIEYHPTFVKYGHFHKNHKNKSSDPKYGVVEKSWYNPKMHRVELIVALDNNKNNDVLNALERSEDIPVSMAAKLPFDICSICGHKRTTPRPKDTCSHIKDDLTKIKDDGKQVYCINTEPKFFDISKVWKPADRTAYVLRKVASLNKKASVSPPKRIFQPYRKLTKTALSKIALIKKLSELEKRIEGELAGKVEDGKIKALKKGVAKANLPEDILKLMKNTSNSKNFSTLADKGILLRPKEFIRIVLKEPKPRVEDSALSLIKGIFSRMSRMSNLDDFYPVDDLDFRRSPGISRLSRLLDPFVGARSIFTKPTLNRTVIIVTSRKPMSEELSLEDKKSDKSDKIKKEGSASLPLALATTYGLYKVSALEYIKNNTKDYSSVPDVMAILENYI
jgi:hypothetical protein